MISWAAFMPLFGKKRRALESAANGAASSRAEMERWRDETYRLRRYIDTEMQRHFETYNGGAIRQMQQLHELRLPTPWVPVGIKSIDDPVPDRPVFSTVTYVREQRFVPIREAGKI